MGQQTGKEAGGWAALFLLLGKQPPPPCSPFLPPPPCPPDSEVDPRSGAGATHQEPHLGRGSRSACSCPGHRRRLRGTVGGGEGVTVTLGPLGRLSVGWTETHATRSDTQPLPPSAWESSPHPCPPARRGWGDGRGQAGLPLPTQGLSWARPHGKSTSTNILAEKCPGTPQWERGARAGRQCGWEDTGPPEPNGKAWSSTVQPQVTHGLNFNEARAPTHAGRAPLNHIKKGSSLGLACGFRGGEVGWSGRRRTRTHTQPQSFRHEKAGSQGMAEGRLESRKDTATGRGN